MNNDPEIFPGFSRFDCFTWQDPRIYMQRQARVKKSRRKIVHPRICEYTGCGVWRTTFWSPAGKDILEAAARLQSALSLEFPECRVSLSTSGQDKPPITVVEVAMEKRKAERKKRLEWEVLTKIDWDSWPFSLYTSSIEGMGHVNWVYARALREFEEEGGLFQEDAVEEFGAYLKKCLMPEKTKREV